MKHVPRDCRLCASLGHPSMAREGRALTEHLAKHPFPKQDLDAQRGEGQ
jgi:hypothetical protein